MQPEDRTRLSHILEYGDILAGFVDGRTRADLETDIQLLLALVRALEIIGEAATRITDALKLDHPDLPWAKLTGMRNRLVHAYFDVNRDIVWNAATVELPPLLRQVDKLLDQD